MFTRTLLLALVASAWGFSSPHRDVAFLSTDQSPQDEGVGPNMHFAPLSTTMKCTINLTIQYIVIFVALGICRTYLDFQQQPYETSPVQKALKHASETVFYAPMACLLFVGFRMRVLQLTKGEGNPPEYVQLAMQGVAYSILANTLLVMIIPVFVKGGDIELDEKTGEMKLDGGNPFENKVLAAVFTAIRYVCFLALYVGFGVVVYGLFTFAPAPGVWVDASGAEMAVPALSPAVFCTCMLSCMFFLIFCLLAISRTYSQFTVGNTKETTFEKTMLQAADTLAMAPMFCVLFLGARMRALQMDPIGGNPQRWAQNCFYTCTWALVVQCCLAMAIPLTGVGSVKRGAVEGDMEYEVSNNIVAKVLTGVRWFIMLCIYVAATAVVCSVFTHEHPGGAELTPPISPTMQCVINLAFQYFTIYILVWAFFTFEHFAPASWNVPLLTKIRDAVESAKSTVQFAPMLSVLFIATRMRALQITEGKGSPQGYVQDGMYLASWAVLIQFLMCLIMPFFTGEKFEVRSLDGTTSGGKQVKKDNVGNMYGAWTVCIIRYLAVAALLGGTATVITGVFLMTPENANGSGSIPLVGDYVEKPPAATDIPGMENVMKNTGQGIGAGADVVHGAGEATTGAVESVGDKAASAVSF